MNGLSTTAEQQALKATSLPAFENVALLGLKSQVAEMLTMIGRVSEIFATYSKHDISHINAMLKHLDWIIPPSTQKEMTPVDWLLITLAIYFHDLGMLVTTQEFDERIGNEEFRSFLDALKNDQNSQDYLGRAKKMPPEQQERFFFQEFIRENHATRIKEWITGRHSRHWGDTVKPIAEEIAKLTDPLPARFRENLATVCESHHRDNLNRFDLYPLSQRYGNDPLEIANVQYAALLLRTVDLIHVTKDRTPSIMYRTIKFSDPKGVDEWDKQKTTFSVRHAGRRFIPDDQATHIITLSADFTEERPFFALTEYLAWADVEIRQTKRWGDQSRTEKDAASFWFPWQGVRGDLRVEGNEPQQMRFEFDRGRLLDLLVGHAIYNDATVAIRELLQNAIDAVRFRHHLDSREAEATGRPVPPMGRVSVSWYKETRRLVVEDLGTGMDLDIIKYHLMRVGSSFYDTPQFAAEHKGFTPISRFGIGILTCFMISDDIEIITIKDSSGYRIRMSSVHADYLLRELPRGDIKLSGIEPHGTRVTLVVREGVDLEKRTVEDILRHWIVLPECQVSYSEDGRPFISIGFESPSAALARFYEESSKEKQVVWKDLEFVRMHREVYGGRFEMALAVQSGWIPEKSFALAPRTGLPAVCIEGIRVSDFLPDFGGTDIRRPVVALVSVRGVRGLRTTVSRSGLEQDEIYLNLGRTCVDMLMDHVREEIRRISDAKGRPLSRASTAGKWLSADLMAAIHPGAVSAYLWQKRKKLPLIVMERMETRNSSPVVERLLVSPEALEQEAFFWTIESRLVDSLGIISRDLGRELSLNEFLTSLAPEHAGLGHSPILPDAGLFASDILASHHPDLVQYSLSYQQTAIKWNPGKIKKIELEDEVFAGIVSMEYRKLRERGDRHLPIDFGEKIAVVEISGDEPEVQIVRTRIVTLLEEGSEIAEIWGMIQRGMEISYERKQAHDLLELLQLAALFTRALKPPVGANVYGEIGSNELIHLWKDIAESANSILKSYGLSGGIPVAVDSITTKKVFDASDYWRDWHRTRS